ncbi:uncharacterized protein LOC124920674 [Impatiens glandulifera]|uniref:uncharacterized protein LOC124920674 n=1 Tax=Impatiens glandulifera TaxID=253017 RepID=UPI001FB14DAE|nr:uncharacterized protein LOC124920674 [Impatiens glandulifera]
MSEAGGADQMPAALHGLEHLQNGNIQMFPVIYPVLVPGSFHVQNEEQVNRGAGIYAVPVLPFAGPVAGFPSNNLIPLTYNVPTQSSSTAGEAGEQQQAVPQRQIVVRRFQIAIHLDVLLIMKLAAVIFLFNQEGSRQRLALLVFFASLVYLYQTGALAPLIRWLSQGMQRRAQPPRPAARAEGIENAVVPDEQPDALNEHAVEDNDGNRWWGIVKEVQMIVFGFITSLLPGFHNID